jgi:hypothetical protein
MSDLKDINSMSPYAKRQNQRRGFWCPLDLLIGHFHSLICSFGNKNAIIGAVIGGFLNITIMIYVVLLGPTLVPWVPLVHASC